MFKGKRYYSDFLSSNEKMSTNILADRLKRLEQLGMATKTADESNRSKSVYSLTEKGKDLLPVMLEITLWSGKYDDKTNAPSSLLKRLKKDKQELIEEIKAGWEAVSKK
jgi:DNA-binding HxlR family transcriptional regulator